MIRSSLQRFNVERIETFFSFSVRSVSNQTGNYGSNHELAAALSPKISSNSQTRFNEMLLRSRSKPLQASDGCRSIVDADYYIINLYYTSEPRPGNLHFLN